MKGVHLALVASLVLGVGFVGCMGGTERSLEYYHVVLHPVNYTWHPGNQTVSGNVTFTNIPPSSLELNGSQVELTDLEVEVRYFEEWGHPGSQPADASWDLRYTSRQKIFLEQGETLMANFSVPPNASVDDVGGVEISITYDYLSTFDDAETPWRVISVDWEAPCLRVQNGRLNPYYGVRECQPFDLAGLGSTYEMSIDKIPVPPVEHWDEWGDMPPAVQPAYDFLEGFTYAGANVTYFEGEISCSGCLTGGR